MLLLGALFGRLSVFSYPGMTILDVAEPYLLRTVLKQMAETYGMMYLRFPRKEKGSYYKGTEELTIGKGAVVREGTDAAVIASGIEVKEALKAAEVLEEKGISVRVVDMFTIKPLDEELVLSCAEETGAVVTAENHNKIGDFGSAVAEVLLEQMPVPFKRVGVPDCFGEVGDKRFLSEKFGISAADIVSAAEEVIKRK